MGSRNIGLRVGVGGGAHTCFIGEESALGALGDRCLESHTEAAADDCLGGKGVAEDHAECCGNQGEAHEQYNESPEQEYGRHDRDDLFRDKSKTLHTANENDRTDDDQNNTHDPGRNAESGMHRGTD